MLLNGLVIVLLILVALVAYTRWRVAQAEKKYPPIGKFITVDGVRLHYVRHGAGSPVVLLHGHDGFLQDYTLTIFDRVAAEYDAIAFDRPGHGYSQRPKHSTPTTQARLIHDALKQLGIEKPVLVGHSWSGALVMAYALQFPNDVAAIVSLAGWVYGSGAPLPLLVKLPLVPILGDLFVNTIWTPLAAGPIRQSLVRAFHPSPVQENYFDAAKHLWSRPYQAKTWAIDIANANRDLIELSKRYHEVRVPMVIVNGDADLDVSAEGNAIPLQRVVKNSKLVILPETGHEIPHTRPDAMMQAIRDAWQMARAENRI